MNLNWRFKPTILPPVGRQQTWAQGSVPTQTAANTKLKFHRQGTCFRCGFTRENRANVARIRVQYVAMY